MKDEIEAPFYIEITREYILLNAISNSLFDAITFFSSLFFFFTRISDVQRPLCIQIPGISKVFGREETAYSLFRVRI